MSSPAQSAGSRNPLLWGAYLACSWTWCIGMFLPILLLRDMGWAGYWIFAIPNVIGAAAMGWVIKTKSASVEFVERHSRAIWWFSAITLSFHLYWMLWFVTVIPAILGISTRCLVGSMGFVGLFAVICRRTTHRGKAAQTAVLLLVLSLCVLIGASASSGLQEANTALLKSVQSSAAPLWMMPVMLFGFLLCPHLDITFHHARQQLDSAQQSRIGFTIGFVGFFSCMIFLTTRYAGIFSGAMQGLPRSDISPWLASGILIHILCQWFFTVSVHLDRIRTLSEAESKQKLLVVLLVAAGLIGILAPWLSVYAGLTGGEVIYRLFMSAYGLIFPAYLLYRAMARKEWKPSFWLTTALASPLFWMGFIERQPVWLLPGMVLILVGAMIQRMKHAS